MNRSAASAVGVKNPVTSGHGYRPLPPSWWVTPPGRNAVGLCAGVASGIWFGGYTLLHSWFLENYRNVVMLHKHGFPTPLPANLIVRCQDTLADVKLNLSRPNLVNFFCVVGMDLFHAGSTKLVRGSMIGVPTNFSYSSTEDIEKQDIVVENQPIEWGSEGGQLLQDSLILSERAQKFGIAREIFMTHNHGPYIHGGLGAAGIMSYYGLTRVINDKFHGLSKPRSFRIVVYSMVGTFVFGLWVTATDLITKYYENRSDKSAGGLGLEYAKGGVEFYARILQRNMALRQLMGPSGEKTYTFYGNDVEFIRQRHVPFTERKQNLENIAEQLSSNMSNVSTHV